MKVQPTTQQLIAMLYERLPELFDRPQRQSLRDVKPLTSAEIRKWWSSENGMEDCDMAKLDDFEQVVRAVEGKHGIKGDA